MLKVPLKSKLCARGVKGCCIFIPECVRLRRRRVSGGAVRAQWPCTVRSDTVTVKAESPGC